MLPTLLGRLMLLAFPRGLRERIGRPLLQTLTTDCRTRSGRLAIGRTAANALDVVRAGLAARVAGWHRPAEIRQPRGSALDATWQDLRYGVRRLNHSRGFTAVAVLTLTLAIGANSALFQLLDAVQLRSLPVNAAGELAEIRIRNPEGLRGAVSVWHAGATNAIWEQIRRRQEAFSGIFAWSPGGTRLTADGVESRWVSALLVSGDFFPVLGVQPALGRLFTTADDTPRCTAPDVVLSHAFWQTALGGDPGIVGRTLRLGRVPYRVAGVTPREFTGLDVGHRFDIAVPLCSEWLPPGSFNRLESGVDWFLIVMGRLKPGWGLERASAHVAAMSPAVFDASLPPNYPADGVKSYRGFQLQVIDASAGISALREQFSGALWFLQATAALVLLVGCANLANLMLARASTREREIAARVALGASRAQVIRVLLVESLLLSIVGAAAGAWLASAMSGALVAFLDGGSHDLFLPLTFDWRILAFTSLAATLTCVLSGLAPAWRAAETPPETVLRAGSRGLTDGGSRVGLRQVLVASQVGLSFVLLAGALLFGRSLQKLVTQDLGLNPDGLTIAYVDMSGTKVPVDRRTAFKRDMLRDLMRTPGIVAAADTSVIPLSGSSSDNDVWMDGARGARAVSFFMDIGAGYFDTVGTPLVAGRAFDDNRDTTASPRVAVVNEAFAAKFAAGANPVGQRVWREARSDEPETGYEIVGVVKNAKYQHLRQELRPIVYVASSQDPRPGTFAMVLVRTSLASASAAPALRAAFAQAAPAAIPTFQDFREMVGRLLIQDRLMAGLSGFFGVLALLLSVIGLYGSMSFAVARRTREIGVRIALGADRRGILRLVLSEASLLVAIGCLAGCALALFLGRLVATLVYQLEPHDPASLAAALLLLSAVALAACVIPACRAARLDPMTAFRAE
jgi:putative ABC transport system permease protein